MSAIKRATQPTIYRDPGALPPHKTMTIEDVIAFVSKNPGQQIPTIGGRAKFSVRPRGEKAFVFVTQNKKERNENYNWIGKSLKVFNATGSLEIQDYGHTVNASYVLGLFKAIVADQELTSATESKSTLSEDISEIISNTTVEETTRQALIDARVGQGIFRASVLSKWDKRCAVTSSCTRAAIRASHIKPWRDSTNDERLDAANGLPLVASLDALFDAGLISFEDSGRMIVSTLLTAQEQAIYSVAERTLTKPPPAETRTYLHHHRTCRFRA